MSLRAKILDTGEIMNAWELKEYIRETKERPVGLACPDCGVRLVAKAVGKGPYARAPHYALPKNSSHAVDCQGISQRLKQRPKRKNRYEFLKDDHFFPTKYVRKGPSSKKLVPDLPGTTGPVKDSQSGRFFAPTTSRRSMPEVSDVEILAERYESVANQYRSHYPDKKDINWDVVNEARKEMILILPGNRTNYKDGFRTPAGVISCKECVYHGNAVMYENTSFFELRARYKLEKEKPFTVKVSKGLLTDDSPQIHRYRFNRLREAVAKNTTVKFYALGIIKDGDNLVLPIQSLWDLFIR